MHPFKRRQAVLFLNKIAITTPHVRLTHRLYTTQPQVRKQEVLNAFLSV